MNEIYGTEHLSLDDSICSNKIWIGFKGIDEFGENFVAKLQLKLKV